MQINKIKFFSEENEENHKRTVHGKYDEKPPPNENGNPNANNNPPCLLTIPVALLILNPSSWPVIQLSSVNQEVINSILRPALQPSLTSKPYKETFVSSTMSTPKVPSSTPSNYLNIFGTSTPSRKPSSKPVTPTRPAYKPSDGSVYSFDIRASAITPLSTGKKNCYLTNKMQ